MGDPLDYPNQVSDMLNPERTFAMRRFKKGIVLVNPFDKDAEFKLDNDHNKVIPQGGGVVSKDGTYSGRLVYEAVSGKIKIPKKSAMILLKN